MSIKKFFDATSKSRKYVRNTDKKRAFKDIESAANARQQLERQNSLLPQVNYADPTKFAKFGSAYLYYNGAIDRVTEFYPYDGSEAEITAFYNKALPIEKYIFNRMYPRTNGYAIFSAQGWGTSTVNGMYGIPTSKEYIQFKAGPNIDSSITNLKDMEPNPLSSKFQNNNIYDTSIYTSAGLRDDYGVGTRESNLKSNFNTGVTVEFWLKTGSFEHASVTPRQVVFDMWNNELSSSEAYSRITIELTGGAGSGTPFLITAQSGNASSSAQICVTSSIGNSLSASSLSEWGHYAITMFNSGTSFVSELYVNGHLNDTNVYPSTINELNSKNMEASIGGLMVSPSGTIDSSNAFKGAGKLSGSLDEFRFWKARRDGREIGTSWFTQIRGGVNTDIANTTLGMYYKFNEGIVGDPNVDNTVLDYGGRLCNGTWTGYTISSRNTGSAMLSASVAHKEYEDPIVYPQHPAIVNLRSSLQTTGSWHDSQNSALMRNLLPSWLTDDMTIPEESDLDKVCHIIGAYFDKISLQIGQLQVLKNARYVSASSEAYPFAQHLPQSLGLYTPDIFVDATVLENFMNRTETEQFEGDLSNTKNLIYTNLHNNLAHIFKAKGTEKAIRNTLRCFNLDDTLIRYNVYANNQQFELRNNLQHTLKKRTYANFNTPAGSTAVIYQSEDPHTSSRGYISGTHATGYEDRHGLTAEASITFPRFIRQLDKVDRDFTTVSLFGLQTVHTGSTSDTAFLTGAQDVVNFQVLAERDKPYSKNVSFKLTSSTDPHPFPTLTSSYFFDVYDDSNWNFSVRVKPSNYPLTEFLSGATEYNYDVVFRGINNNLTTILNSFEVTGTVSEEVGKNMLQAAKRVYVGAYGTNITSSNIYKTDVLVSSAKYWTKYIDNATLNQHLYDTENYGVSGSYKYVNALDSNAKDTYNFNTLALNWYFGNLTSSNSSGDFYVTDLSSGSVENRNKFGWMGNISSYLHTARGYRFDTSNTNIIDTRNVNESKFIDPEKVTSSDMVQILDSDDESFGIAEQVPNYTYTIEKSVNSAITEEILDFFAGAIDFHQIIGQPVNRYREQYKAMGHLRRVFFEKVQDRATAEKFAEYYKWFDDAIAIIIGQMVPASADFVPDIFNTVESHVLERNKYKTQFPTIEFRAPDPETTIRGYGELTADYGEMSTPLPSSPRSTTIKGEYWQKRAETDATETTSGDVDIDSQRQTIKEVLWSKPYMSKSITPTISTPAGIKYHLSQRIRSQLNSVYKVDMAQRSVIKGGTNFEPQKNIHYAYSALQPAGPVYAPSGGVYVPQNVLLGRIEDMADNKEFHMDRYRNANYWSIPSGSVSGSGDSLHPNMKTKRYFKVLAGRDYEQGVGYPSMKSTIAFPFNVISSSVHSGFNKQVVSNVTSGIEITNLHNDVYGNDMERPMQGPFSEYAAGGHQSRHVPLNISGANKSDIFKGLDDYTTRPEAWKILLGDCPGTGSLSGAIGMVAPDYPWPEANDVGANPYPMTASQKATYYRDFVAKTPYVFKNIRIRTGSTFLGNYRNNYEVVHTFGARSNPRQFIEEQPNLPTGAFQNGARYTDQIRTIYSIHRNDDGHTDLIPEYNLGYITGTANKTVMVSRFSNPGGLEVSPAGYRDFRGGEYSVYNHLNYRNKTVTKPSQGPAGTVTELAGVGGPGIRVFDHLGLDFGLRSRLARHTAKFGRDSLVYPDDDTRITYDLTKPFLGYGKVFQEASASFRPDRRLNSSSSHGHYRANGSLQGWWRLNQDVSSDGDVTDSSGKSRDGSFASAAARPEYSGSSGPSKYIQTSSCGFNGGAVDSANIGIAATWDAIIGNDTANGSSEQMSFCAWVYKTGDGGYNVGRIIDFGESDVALYTDAQDEIRFTAKWNGAGVYWTTRAPTGSIVKNSWYHVAATYDATSVNNDPIVYINGEETPVDVSSGTKTGTYDGIATEACYIGNRDDASSAFDGGLADVAVWNSILTREDIATIYSAGKGPNASGSLMRSFGPGSSDNAFHEAPNFHKVYRNNIPRVKIASTTNSPIYNPLNCQNDRAAYWSGNLEDTVLINTASTTAQAFVSGARANSGLSSTGWIRFTPTSEATDNVWLWSVGRTSNGDPMFFMEKGKTGSPGGTGDCKLISAGGTIPNDSGDDHLAFTLSTRSTAEPTATGTRKNIEYRAFLPENTSVDINDGEVHHIALVMSGSDGDLVSSLSASFYVDGIKCFTCKNGTSTVQEYYDRYANDYGTTGFMSYNGASGEEFNFSDTATNPLAVIPNTQYRGDEFISIGGDTSTIAGVTNTFSGSMDQLAFWSRPISDSDVTELYNSGAPINITASTTYTYDTSALIVWLPLGEGFNTLDPDDVDIIGYTTGDPAFNSSSHAIWDMSGKQNNFYAINAAHSKADAVQVHFATGAASHDAAGGYNPAHVPGRLDILGYEEKHTYVTSSLRDNAYVQHLIPRSDRQYAFFTGAMLDPNRDLRFVGYMPTAGPMVGSYSSSLSNGVQPFFNLLSASDFGSVIQSGVRGWGSSRNATNATSFIPTAFSNLNLNIYEPVSITHGTHSTDPIYSTYEKHHSMQNTLGYPSGAVLTDGLAGTQQYRNTTLVTNMESATALPQREATIFNAVMLKRYGPYGYGTYAQARQYEHPVVRAQKRAQTIQFWSREAYLTGTVGTVLPDGTMVFTVDPTIRYRDPAWNAFDLRPVSLKGRPSAANYDFVTQQQLSDGTWVSTEDNVTLKATYNNEHIYFNSRSLDNYLGIPEMMDSAYGITPFEQLLALRTGVSNRLNWVSYVENIFPSMQNEFSPKSSFRYGYDNLMWRRGLDDRIILGSKTVLTNSVGMHHRLSASSWPLDAPEGFLTRTEAPRIATPSGTLDLSSLRAGGALYIATNSAGTVGTLLGQTISSRGIAGELQNTYGWLHETSSNRNSSGAPWNTSTFYSSAIRSALTPAALYARKHTLASPLSINPPSYPNTSASIQAFGLTGGVMPYVGYYGASTSEAWGFRTASFGAGEAYWDAPATAGYLTSSGYVKPDGTIVSSVGFVSAASAPWYHDYEELKQQIKSRARGFAVLPEFRISERLESYLDGAADHDKAEFTIPGTSFTSQDTTFYMDFANSDFMGKFADMRDKTSLHANEIRLTAKAVIQFNPYKGFYPADRTIQLAERFKKSYEESITLYGDDSGASFIEYGTASVVPDSDGTISVIPKIFNAEFRQVMQPLFAPGILYNSIKSGIACDWPMVTQRGRIRASAFTSSAFRTADNTVQNGTNYAWYPNVGWVSDWLQTGSFWDNRLPFEAIINPSKHLQDVHMVDMEPHPKVGIGDYANVTASLAGPSDSLYTLMASNFVAEVADFFLEEERYSRLEAAGPNLGTMTFAAGDIFGARLRMRSSHSGSRTYEYESSSFGDNTWFTTLGAGGTYLDACSRTDRLNGTTTGSFEIPQDPSRNPTFKRDYMMYSRTTAFGPPWVSWPDGEHQYAQYTVLRTIDALSGAGVPNYSTSGTFDEWSEQQNVKFSSLGSRGAMDSLNGYNWAYTPPYYHGEAWCDFIFRPTPGEAYDLQRILQETSTSYYRCDPGPQTSSFSEAFFGTTPKKFGGVGLVGNFNNQNYSSLIEDHTRLSGGFVATGDSNNHSGLVVQPNNSIYSSTNINKNAMQLSASLNLWGMEDVYNKRFDAYGREILSERELIGRRWVIQPKFETPMMNFANAGGLVRPVAGESTGSAARTKTIPMIGEGAPGYGADTAADGMWHQFGTLPQDMKKGIFLEMTDIPGSWLRYHYSVVSQSSVYNNFDPSSVGGVGESTLHAGMKSFADLMGFNGENNQVRLGEIASAQSIKEAIVVIPYIQDYTMSEDAEYYDGLYYKKFFEIPRSRIDAALGVSTGTAPGDSLHTAGPSIRRMIGKILDYVLPPKFDYIRNPLAKPIVMYFLEFEYQLDKDDLSYIWQNLAPKKHKKTKFAQQATAHALLDTELMNEESVLENPSLRWLVFKVKERSQKTYGDKVVPQFGAYTMDPIVASATISDYPLQYNWPYDYVSIIELAKLDIEMLYKDTYEPLAEILLGEGVISEEEAAPTPGGTMTDLEAVSPSVSFEDLSAMEITDPSTGLPTPAAKKAIGSVLLTKAKKAKSVGGVSTPTTKKYEVSPTFRRRSKAKALRLQQERTRRRFFTEAKKAKKGGS